jgi:nucleotide-binding universal stress UspA family protein
MSTVVLGVDLDRAYQHAENLLNELKFRDMDVLAICACEPLIPDVDPTGLSQKHPIHQAMGQQRESALSELAQAAERMKGSFRVDTAVILGGASSCLTRESRKMNADLIAVGSERKDAFASLFLGSVTKGLAIDAQRSILIGRKPTSGSGITAVIATDHSDYMTNCLNRLVELAPAGLSKVVLVSAFHVEAEARSALAFDHPELAAFAPQALEAKLTERSEASKALLAPLNCEVEIMVGGGHPNDVINDAMAQTNADLLILGAQGHGFIERHALGSTSMHFVVAEDHNLLILRV